MSRFGLRSSSESGFKVNDEKQQPQQRHYHQLQQQFGRRNLCKSLASPIKCVSGQQLVAADDVEDEVLENRRAKDSTLLNQDQEFQHGENNCDDETSGVMADHRHKSTLICSVPLERISNVIERLHLLKTNLTNYPIQAQIQHQHHYDHQQQHEQSHSHDKLKDCKECRDCRTKSTSKQKLANVEGDDKIELDPDPDPNKNPNVGDETNSINIKMPSVSSIGALQHNNPTQSTKILCLYCDKKFSSHKMQLKHVEKFHCQQPDRRCSGRNIVASTSVVNSGSQSTYNNNSAINGITATATTTSMTVTSAIAVATSSMTNSLSSPIYTNRKREATDQVKDIATVGRNVEMKDALRCAQNFPGCFYCCKGKNPVQVSGKPSIDLNGLFLHLIDAHADKYFACKLCSIRFQNRNKLNKHFEQQHQQQPMNNNCHLQQEREHPTHPPSSVSKAYPDDKHNCTKRRSNKQQKDALINTVIETNKQQTHSHQRISTQHSSDNGGDDNLNLMIKSISNGDTNRSSNGVNNDECADSAFCDDQPLLSRLGLTPNRLPNNRKVGVHLRRDNTSSTSENLLISDQQATVKSEASEGGDGNRFPVPSINNGNSLHHPSTKSRGKSGSKVSTNNNHAVASSSRSSSGGVNGSGITGVSLSQFSNEASVTASAESNSDNVFRMPTSTRNDILSSVFDDNFYKEVVANVRYNLQFHLDGKIRSGNEPVESMATTSSSLSSASSSSILNYSNSSSEDSTRSTVILSSQPPQIRSTLVKSPLVVTTMDYEIHAATSLTTVAAFPTLLTAEQYGGDATSSKIRRRPHTKNSWKWKWDKVKKFKIINEGGKMIKKVKHSSFGLRDLSKLDMWTQLTMRQRHELYQQKKMLNTANTTTTTSSNDRNVSDHHLALNDNSSNQLSSSGAHSSLSDCLSDSISTKATDNSGREERQRLNDQLNLILDMRVLPHIILEQNEQTTIKTERVENIEEITAGTEAESDELDGAFCGKEQRTDCTSSSLLSNSSLQPQLASDSILSVLNLLPIRNSNRNPEPLVLSGEWARPRCYLCMCCGAKFDKLKTLEEHKMFRHSHIFSTHYEIVGRERLVGNLLKHLFIPKKALNRYSNSAESPSNSKANCRSEANGAVRRLFWHKDESVKGETSTTISNSSNGNNNNEESYDSLQSIHNSSTTNSPCTKQSSSTEDSETTSTAPAVNNSVNCSSASDANQCRNGNLFSKMRRSATTSSPSTMDNRRQVFSCSKCERKCNGIPDLYRHMLDCSGDYIWAMVKKRKYRYYCGSKKRRQCNKHYHLYEMGRKIPSRTQSKSANTASSMKGGDSSTTNGTQRSSQDDVDGGGTEGAVTTEDNSSSSHSHTFNKMPMSTKTSPRPSRASDAESIRKMLENLPPKRICKKIFPSLTKPKPTTKPRRKLPPQIMAQQKIYRKLRKTKMRRIQRQTMAKTKITNRKQKQQRRVRKKCKTTENVKGRKTTRKQKLSQPLSILSSSSSSSLASSSNASAVSTKTSSLEHISPVAFRNAKETENNRNSSQHPITSTPKKSRRRSLNGGKLNKNCTRRRSQKKCREDEVNRKSRKKPDISVINAETSADPTKSELSINIRNNRACRNPRENKTHSDASKPDKLDIQEGHDHIVPKNDNAVVKESLNVQATNNNDNNGTLLSMRKSNNDTGELYYETISDEKSIGKVNYQDLSAALKEDTTAKFDKSQEDLKQPRSKQTQSLPLSASLQQAVTVVPSVTTPTTTAVTSRTTTTITNNSTPKSTVAKRGKRISDCIAMLTGKLEEKLKTAEQKATDEKPPARESANIKGKPEDQMQLFPQSSLSTETPLTDAQPYQTQQEDTLDEETSKGPKKIPKRKTVSRRIIKSLPIEKFLPENQGEIIEGQQAAIAPPFASSSETPPTTISSTTFTTIKATNSKLILNKSNTVLDTILSSATATSTDSYSNHTSDTVHGCKEGFQASAAIVNKNCHSKVISEIALQSSTATGMITTIPSSSSSASLSPSALSVYNHNLLSKIPMYLPTTTPNSNNIPVISTGTSTGPVPLTIPLPIPLLPVTTTAIAGAAPLLEGSSNVLPSINNSNVMKHGSSNVLKTISTLKSTCNIIPTSNLVSKTIATVTTTAINNFTSKTTLNNVLKSTLSVPKCSTVTNAPLPPLAKKNNQPQPPLPFLVAPILGSGVPSRIPPSTLPILSLVKPRLPVSDVCSSTMEPLNLSQSINNSLQSNIMSSDGQNVGSMNGRNGDANAGVGLNLSRDSRQQPLRRQTICGFEGKHYLHYPDPIDEPLDLSKKSQKLPTNDCINLSAIKNAPQLLPLSLKTVDMSKSLALSSEYQLHNKTYYSNLELLRIPQVRNPTLPIGNTNPNHATDALSISHSASIAPMASVSLASGVVVPQLNATPAGANLLPISSTTINTIITAATPLTIMAVPTTAVTSAIVSVPAATVTTVTTTVTATPVVARTTTGGSGRKRNSRMASTSIISVGAAGGTMNEVNLKSGKDQLNTSTKGVSGGGKFVPKMDEVVINHIDDAINSVINAVKASLQDSEDEEEECKRRQQQINNSTTKTTNIPVVMNSIIGRNNPIPNKRTVRSRTVDCRSMLNIPNIIPTDYNRATTNAHDIAEVSGKQQDHVSVSSGALQAPIVTTISATVSTSTATESGELKEGALYSSSHTVIKEQVLGNIDNGVLANSKESIVANASPPLQTSTAGLYPTTLVSTITTTPTIDKESLERKSGTTTVAILESPMEITRTAIETEKLTEIRGTLELKDKSSCAQMNNEIAKGVAISEEGEKMTGTKGSSENKNGASTDCNKPNGRPVCNDQVKENVDTEIEHSRYDKDNRKSHFEGEHREIDEQQINSISNSRATNASKRDFSNITSPQQSEEEGKNISEHAAGEKEEEFKTTLKNSRYKSVDRRKREEVNTVNDKTRGQEANNKTATIPSSTELSKHSDGGKTIPSVNLVELGCCRALSPPSLSSSTTTLITTTTNVTKKKKSNCNSTLSTDPSASQSDSLDKQQENSSNTRNSIATSTAPTNNKTTNNNNNDESRTDSAGAAVNEAATVEYQQPTASMPAQSTTSDFDPRKKQRRRRKNELAAIVADQLLESFKLDKARRDNLKKLENLAYEKSEDLLLTGMLLMSTTKRNVSTGAAATTMSTSIVTAAETLTTTAALAESHAISNAIAANASTTSTTTASAAVPRSAADSGRKRGQSKAQKDGGGGGAAVVGQRGQRCSSRLKSTAKQQQQEDEEKEHLMEIKISGKGAGRQAIQQKREQETPKKPTPTATKKSRQHSVGNGGINKRHSSKLLDNENISKLKTSLESFSIDIERQLTEYESKNATGNAAVSRASLSYSKANDNEQVVNTTRTTTAPPAPVSVTTSILRPSILSSLALDQQQQPPNNGSSSLAYVHSTAAASVMPSSSTTNANPLSAINTSNTINSNNLKDKSKSVISSRDPRLNKNIHKGVGGEDGYLGVGSEARVMFSNCSRLSSPLSRRPQMNHGFGPEDVGDLDEDNYLTEIAKNVNEKIMSTENEEFSFKDADGFELANNNLHDIQDDSCCSSKYSRPPTSMSVRSAPNFNDDRSNFGSICDENTTNTHALDMDMDDEMSVYTSYSQDLGRGRGGHNRRRRRRRSILLTRKPKKRSANANRDPSADRIECILCKKTFYSANSLTKHNMTLAHVSKVSEREYILAKSLGNGVTNKMINEEHNKSGSLGPYARRLTARRATISEPPSMLMEQQQMSNNLKATLNSGNLSSVNVSTLLPSSGNVQSTSIIAHSQNQQNRGSMPDTPMNEAPFNTNDAGYHRGAYTSLNDQHNHPPRQQMGGGREDESPMENRAPNLQKSVECLPSFADRNAITGGSTFQENSHLNLNADERLFFECCNILKGVDNPSRNNDNQTNPPVTHSADSNSNDDNEQEKQIAPPNSNPLDHQHQHHYPLYHQHHHQSSQHPKQLSQLQYQLQQQFPLDNGVRPLVHQDAPSPKRPFLTAENTSNQSSRLNSNNNSLNINNKTPENRNGNCISTMSSTATAPVATTSRLKTKAAMKGYENTNIDLNSLQQQPSSLSLLPQQQQQQQQMKALTGNNICKLTELAEIALGSEHEKPLSATELWLANNAKTHQQYHHQSQLSQGSSISYQGRIVPKESSNPQLQQHHLVSHCCNLSTSEGFVARGHNSVQRGRRAEGEGDDNEEEEEEEGGNYGNADEHIKHGQKPQIKCYQGQDPHNPIPVTAINSSPTMTTTNSATTTTTITTTTTATTTLNRQLLPPLNSGCLRCPMNVLGDRAKNSENQSSTSSKTIMHSSIVKAAVEEHQRSSGGRSVKKIIIPDRPFKNIGLEEKETITFQKPRISAVNLLANDNNVDDDDEDDDDEDDDAHNNQNHNSNNRNNSNSVSTASFSDRDDYDDFGSLSGGEDGDDPSVHDSTLNGGNNIPVPKTVANNNTTMQMSNRSNHNHNSSMVDTSSESSRNTAKTLENKSLIMGRIFKNASTTKVTTTTKSQLHHQQQQQQQSSHPYHGNEVVPSGGIRIGHPQPAYIAHLPSMIMVNQQDGEGAAKRPTTSIAVAGSTTTGTMSASVMSSAVQPTSSSVKVKSVGVQNDHHHQMHHPQAHAPVHPHPAPTSKADLNQLFDELRGKCNRVEDTHHHQQSSNVKPSSSSSITGPCCPGTVAGGCCAHVGPSNGTQRDSLKQQQQARLLHTASPPAVVSSTTATPIVGGTRKGRNETRPKVNTATARKNKARKDLTKLQSELGMSPDEIKKLIDEGQRKSKRRCATNRPKKLVEMWSSDEYEELLSTKDIIALIEEKEQQEKRAGRKRSIETGATKALSTANPTILTGATVSAANGDVTSSTKDNRNRRGRGRIPASAKVVNAATAAVAASSKGSPVRMEAMAVTPIARTNNNNDTSIKTITATASVKNPIPTSTPEIVPQRSGGGAGESYKGLNIPGSSANRTEGRGQREVEASASRKRRHMDASVDGKEEMEPVSTTAAIRVKPASMLMMTNSEVNQMEKKKGGSTHPISTAMNAASNSYQSHNFTSSSTSVSTSTSSDPHGAAEKLIAGQENNNSNSDNRLAHCNSNRRSSSVNSSSSSSSSSRSSSATGSRSCCIHDNPVNATTEIAATTGNNNTSTNSNSNNNNRQRPLNIKSSKETNNSKAVATSTAATLKAPKTGNSRTASEDPQLPLMAVSSSGRRISYRVQNSSTSSLTRTTRGPPKKSGGRKSKVDRGHDYVQENDSDQDRKGESENSNDEEEEEEDDDDDEDFVIAEPRQSRSSKAAPRTKTWSKHSKKTTQRKIVTPTTTAAAAIVSSTANSNRKRSSTVASTTNGKKGTSAGYAGNVDVATNSGNNTRKKRATNTTTGHHSSPRRKRIAAEKLYYWSSSSDDDDDNAGPDASSSSSSPAGTTAVSTHSSLHHQHRTQPHHHRPHHHHHHHYHHRQQQHSSHNSSNSNSTTMNGSHRHHQLVASAPAPSLASALTVAEADYESGNNGVAGAGGEQYQKHGWIVGDSHKKLVTLLAIAKGNKKVDSTCSVKKNGPRRRN